MPADTYGRIVYEGVEVYAEKPGILWKVTVVADPEVTTEDLSLSVALERAVRAYRLKQGRPPWQR